MNKCELSVFLEKVFPNIHHPHKSFTLSYTLKILRKELVSKHLISFST